jgi:2-oxo-4-hydroxy-4-carboxy-5-ureidoimidazoline decarboxylase
LTIDIATLNAMGTAEFVAALDGIFEHSPWVAEAAASARPFADRAALHAAMVAAVVRAGAEVQLGLLRAHPMLARRATLTAESESEQGRLGLQSLDGDAAAEMDRLNQEYFDRFGFPFIIAVRGQRDRAAIAVALRARLEASDAAERAEALAQVARIALFRLEDRVR